MEIHGVFIKAFFNDCKTPFKLCSLSVSPCGGITEKLILNICVCIS